MFSRATAVNKFTELLFALLRWRRSTYSICIIRRRGDIGWSCCWLWLWLIRFRHHSVVWLEVQLRGELVRTFPFLWLHVVCHRRNSCDRALLFKRQCRCVDQDCRIELLLLPRAIVGVLFLEGYRGLLLLLRDNLGLSTEQGRSWSVLLSQLGLGQLCERHLRSFGEILIHYRSSVGRLRGSLCHDSIGWTIGNVEKSIVCLGLGLSLLWLLLNDSKRSIAGPIIYQRVSVSTYTDDWHLV